MLPCEVAVKTLLPVIKAKVARELVGTHRLKQTEAAELLGSTQSSISQYLSGIRGSALKIEDLREVDEAVKTMAHMLMAGKTGRERVIMMEFCKACTAARRERLMCEIHKRLDPFIEIDSCKLCVSLECKSS